jgi:hypothetical protein
MIIGIDAPGRSVRIGAQHLATGTGRKGVAGVISKLKVSHSRLTSGETA